MSSLKGELKMLIARYSSLEVSESLQEIFKEEYAFLKVFLKDSKAAVAAAPGPGPAPGPAPAPAVAEVEPEETITGIPKMRSDAKIKIVKRAAVVEDVGGEEPVAAVAAPAVAPSAVAHSAPAPVSQPDVFRDPKDVKRWQKEQEDKKHAELKAQGVNPDSLLTLENLTRWVVSENRTYAAVARDLVGLPEVHVAQAAKNLGIQSVVAKRRAIIAASKAAKGKKPQLK